MLIILEEIKVCKCCNEFPEIKCKKIWLRGKRMWFAKIECTSKKCNSELTMESERDIIDVLTKIIQRWNYMQEQTPEDNF